MGPRWVVRRPSQVCHSLLESAGISQWIAGCGNASWTIPSGWVFSEKTAVPTGGRPSAPYVDAIYIDRECVLLLAEG